jgi:hypothetical protein
LLLAGLLLEGLVNLASVGNRQFPDPYAQAVRESGIRRSGLVGVVTVFVVVIGHFARAPVTGVAPPNEIIVAACGATMLALVLLAIVSWRRGAT